MSDPHNSDGSPGPGAGLPAAAKQQARQAVEEVISWYRVQLRREQLADSDEERLEELAAGLRTGLADRRRLDELDEEAAARLARDYRARYARLRRRP